MKTILLVTLVVAVFVLYAEACDFDEQCSKVCLDGLRSKCVKGNCTCVHRLRLRAACSHDSDCGHGHCPAPYSEECDSGRCICSVYIIVGK